MPLEPSFGNIDDLNPDWPLGTDPLAEGDDHIRGIKLSLQGNVTGDATQTRLLTDALVALITTDAGVNVKATNPVQANTLLRLQDNADVRVADLLVNLAGLLRVVVATVGQAMELRGSNAAPNDETMAQFNPGGAAKLFQAGIEALSTSANGIVAGVAGQNGRVDVLTSAGANGLRLESGTNQRLIGLVDGSEVHLVASPAGGGAGITMLAADPDGSVTLNFNGVESVRTIPSQGGTNGGIRMPGSADWTTGSGSPEGVVSAGPGSIYSDLVSGSAKPLWMKNFSAGNTGWLAVEFQP